MTKPGVAKRIPTPKPPRPLKDKAWVKRRKEYLIACGRLDQLRQEFGI